MKTCRKCKHALIAKQPDGGVICGKKEIPVNESIAAQFCEHYEPIAPAPRQDAVDAIAYGVAALAKHDAGKPQLSLVPCEIINAIARVREYGVKKYKDPENWRKVDVQRYIDACYRHWLAFVKEPHGVDAESGLPHIYHVACNVAFIIALGEGNEAGYA